MGRAQNRQHAAAQRLRRASAGTATDTYCAGSGLTGIRDYSNPNGNCCMCGKWLRLSKHGKAPRHKPQPVAPVVSPPAPRINKPEIIAFLESQRRDLSVGELLDSLVDGSGNNTPERP